MTVDGKGQGTAASDIDPAEELRAEVGRLRRLEAVAIEFCERCERGEIRSRYTYQRMREALDGS